VFPQVYGSVPIHERLTNLGVLNVLHPLVGYGHEPELLNPQVNDTIYNYTRPFLYSLLKPVTSAITGDTVVCEGTTVTYKVANTNGSNYCWSITGNGTLVADNNNTITVLWNVTGAGSVSVKELNYILAEGEVQSFQTEVVAPAQSNFSFVTNELEVAFTNLSSAASGYQWSFGDNTFTSDTNPAPKNYASGGTYQVTLIAANSFCADTFASTLTIDSCPVADITYQLTNQNAFFYSPVTNTVSYFWNFGDGDSAAVGSPNVFHQYPLAGEYLITLTVQSQLGCKETDTMSILIVAPTSVNDLNKDVVVRQTADGLQFMVYGSAGYEIEVMDIAGRRIEQMKAINHTQLSTASYSSGIYLVKITAGADMLVKRFVKQ
jgi:PKD repeat protein